MIIGEEGTPETGAKVEVSRDTPMEEGKIYEFHYGVTSLPLGWPLEKLRAFIISKWIELTSRFRGLKVLYWKLTDTEFIWQGRGVSQSTWKEVALAVVAIAAQGVLLVAGIVLTLKAILQVSPLFVRKHWPAFVLVGLAVVGGIFGLGYAVGRK